MRIFSFSKIIGGAAIIALTLQFAPSGAIISQANALEYAKPKRAFEQGIRFLRSGDLNQAIPALNYAAAKGHFRAKYYLARIYSTTSKPYTDHAKSFQLYLEIVDQNGEVDPVFNLRAAYVARAIVAVARYWKSGIPALDMQPDPERAHSYLDHAAKFFDDQEAQYELAKMYLSGDGMKARPKQGKHWISTLAREGHAEAQAYLGDLYWRGQYVEQNRIQGLAHVILALGNAQAYNRVWIEELYQKIYCQSALDERLSAAIVASNLRKTEPRRMLNISRGASALGLGDFQTVRTCRNGEPVKMPSLSNKTRPGSGG